MRILFVVNPVSGGVGKEEFDEAITSLSEVEDLTIELYTTSGERDHLHIADRFATFKPERIVAVGGDGTIQLVAGIIIEQQLTTPLGIIPSGSANGLATSLGLPADVAPALHAVIHSRLVLPVDLLKINDKHICVHVCDIGANALLVKNYEENQERGMMGYARHVFKSVQDSELLHYRISTPAGIHEKEGYMLIIANAHKYGTGVQISDGSISDGVFEIRNLRKIDLEAAIKAGLTIFNVFIDEEMFSDIVRSKHAEIFITPHAHYQIDGEYMGETNYLKVEILQSAIRIIMPDET